MRHFPPESRRHSLQIACAFLFVFLFLHHSTYGWHINTHIEITRDAISLMPEDLKAIFIKNEKMIEQGVYDPDTLIKDWVNHYHIPGIPEGGALERIEKLTGVVQIKLQKSSSAEATRQLCYLAHYIADLWSPESIVKQDTGPDNAFFLNHSIVVLYDGYQQPIDNIRSYLQKRSEWRWRLENHPSISPLLFSEAVNDIANVWITLWQQSGKEVKALPPAMLEHKREALNVRPRPYTYFERYNQLWSTRTSYSEARRFYAEISIRNEQAMLSKITTSTPFAFLETSIKQTGDTSFFVARMRNKSQKVIPSIALLYPGVKGAAATVTYLEPGQVAKVEAEFPSGATKDQIQIIFAHVD